MKSVGRLLTHCCVALSLLSLLLAPGLSNGSTQSTSVASQSQEIRISDLLKLPGRVLGEGRNTKPEGKYGLVTFRIEQVTLPHATEVEIRGKKTQVAHAFRVMIVGGPFPVRAMPAVIWIDDVAVGYGIENDALREIIAVTFDPLLLRDGATLYLSYGDKKNRAEREAVPEKLKLDRKARIRIEYLTKPEKVLVGQETKIRFKLFDTATNQPKGGLNDVQVLAILTPGVWQKRDSAQEIGDGVYEFGVTPPEAGTYHIYVTSTSQGAIFRQLPFLTLQATSAPERSQ
jgi:hypothetical protein